MGYISHRQIFKNHEIVFPTSNQLLMVQNRTQQKETLASACNFEICTWQIIEKKIPDN